jgi:hypothetical protein
MYISVATIVGIMVVVPLHAAPPVYDVMVVEEDWELTLDTANVGSCSPQFSTAIPIASNAEFVTTWNYLESLGGFVPGGIELQLRKNDQVESCEQVVESALNVNGDRLTWTQVLRTNGTDLDMKIAGCNSQAWGANINTSSVAWPNANVTNLNNYDPQNSVSSSGVCFGRNRVIWFGIVEVRKYSDRGRLISTDTTRRPVYARN